MYLHKIRGKGIFRNNELRIARENSITLDASVDEREISEEKNELLETEKRLHDTER